MPGINLLSIIKGKHSNPIPCIRTTAVQAGPLLGLVYRYIRRMERQCYCDGCVEESLSLWKVLRSLRDLVIYALSRLIGSSHPVGPRHNVSRRRFQPTPRARTRTRQLRFDRRATLGETKEDTGSRTGLVTPYGARDAHDHMPQLHSLFVWFWSNQGLSCSLDIPPMVYERLGIGWGLGRGLVPLMMALSVTILVLRLCLIRFSLFFRKPVILCSSYW